MAIFIEQKYIATIYFSEIEKFNFSDITAKKMARVHVLRFTVCPYLLLLPSCAQVQCIELSVKSASLHRSFRYIYIYISIQQYTALESFFETFCSYIQLYAACWSTLKMTKNIAGRKTSGKYLHSVYIV